MSDLELERAAMAPRRWIELCGSFEKKKNSDDSMILQPRTTRIIEDAANVELFLVPGGRYLVSSGEGLLVWDLGYVSTAECKLVSSVRPDDDFKFCVVQATPDGNGLVILTSYR
jgi:hypothetical protein